MAERRAVPNHGLPLNSEELKNAFDKILQNNNHCHELVEMLTDNLKFESNSELYEKYCKSYVVKLVEKNCDTKYDAELLLAICKLTEESDITSGIDDTRFNYWKNACTYNPLLDPTWKKATVLRNVSRTEDGIISKIIEKIMEQNGKVDIDKDVPENLSLYIPKYSRLKGSGKFLKSVPNVPGWGDSSGKRPFYTLAQINGGILGDRIVFNSISNSNGVLSDERFFVGAREDDGTHNGTKNQWSIGYIPVEDRKVYIIRCYIHNNNPNGPYATARDVRAAFQILDKYATEIPVTGFISSSNATPEMYWSTIVFKNNTPFMMRYIEGSALLENNGIGSKSNGVKAKLSNDIIDDTNSGVLVHYNTLDGSLPGGYQYANYITIRVEAIFESTHMIDYRVEQNMRLVGTKDWSSNVDAKVGDKVEIQIAYTNKSNESQRNVMIRDVMPKNLQYVAGSTVLYNTNHPQGMKINQDDIIANGINIGNYSANGNAFVRFTATVVDNTLQNGANVLVNWAQGGVGPITLQDYACVEVLKENN